MELASLAGVPHWRPINISLTPSQLTVLFKLSFFLGTIDEDNGFQQRSRPLFQERCEKYRGAVCVDHMNSQSLVFMRSGEDQDEIESRLAKNMKHVAKLMSPECYPDALRVACITLFPPCRHVNETTAVPLKMCKESCLGLPKSYCAKGFGLLPHLKIIQAIDDCDALPEVDSNQPCARISLPGELSQILLSFYAFCNITR